jgi:hypothetical protein
MNLRGGLAAVLLVAGCANEEPAVSVVHSDSLVKRLAKASGAWSDTCARPRGERIGLPLALQKETKVREVPADLSSELARAIDGLPRPFSRLFERHVCAVVLMHDAPFTGTARLIDGEEQRGIILLDVDKVNMTPNDWMSFKEASVFALAPNRRIVGRLADPDANVRAILLEFLLLHELGHVLERALSHDELVQQFTHVSWPRKDALEGSPLIHYPVRKKVPPLPDDLVEPYYDLLASGPFASPATLSNTSEDFADSLSTFVHTVVRGRPWELELYEDGAPRRRLTSCWSEARCQAKRSILERLIERWTAS